MSRVPYRLRYAARLIRVEVIKLHVHLLAESNVNITVEVIKLHVHLLAESNVNIRVEVINLHVHLLAESNVNIRVEVIKTTCTPSCLLRIKCTNH